MNTINNKTEISMNLANFFDQLDALGDSVPLDVLKDLLSELKPEQDELSDFLNFEDEKYQRNLLKFSQNYEVLLLCFKPGQQTPVHDHAGSACGVKVIQGSGTEIAYVPTEEGGLKEVSTAKLPAGGVVGSNDMDIHLLGNMEDDGQNLVTLHVYSPPLGEVGNYCLEDNSRVLVTAPTRC